MSYSIIFSHPFKYQISSVLALLIISSQHFLQIIYFGNESSKMTSISQVLVLLAQLIGSLSIEASQTQGFSYGGSLRYISHSNLCNLIFGEISFSEKSKGRLGNKKLPKSIVPDVPSPMELHIPGVRIVSLVAGGM